MEDSHDDEPVAAQNVVDFSDTKESVSPVPVIPHSFGEILRLRPSDRETGQWLLGEWWQQSDKKNAEKCQLPGEMFNLKHEIGRKDRILEWA